MSSAWSERQETDGTIVKLHRGEQMTLIGMDIAPGKIDENFVGFTIEYKEPGNDRPKSVTNRLRFSYDGLTEAQKAAGESSRTAPIQKFRWVHFPFVPKNGAYDYVVTPKYMRPDGSLVAGTPARASIECSDQTMPGILDVGFTRGYGSSQSYANRDRFPCQGSVIPAKEGDELLDHDMSGCATEHAWLGFEGRANIYELLDEAVADATVNVDALIYELKEPRIVASLAALGARLRAVVDDHDDQGKPDSTESLAAGRLHAAGAQVKRMNFSRQQHNKVLVLRKNGIPYKALAGSTNFSMRGLYAQSNNTLVFSDARVADLFGRYFDACFSIADKRGPTSRFKKDPLSQAWHTVDLEHGRIRLAFSPHADPSLSLSPVASAIDGAKSSVLYAMVFLNQLSGDVRRALEDLMQRSVFSYGTSQRSSGLTLLKPDGRRSLVSFAYLAENAPEPFRQEWSSGAGAGSHSNVLHHKFVVVDFDTPECKVFTGSSNMAKGGEENNGDHLIEIADRRVATAFAVEALRCFDHFHFRTKVKEFDDQHRTIALAKPPLPGEAPWWRDAYLPGHVKSDDRLLFSRA